MSIDLVTFGCRLNTYESEAMERQAREAGLEDAVIVNTCAVTAEATRQARQSIRRIGPRAPRARASSSPVAPRKSSPGPSPPCRKWRRSWAITKKMQPGTWQKLQAFGIGESEKVIVDDITAVRETAAHLIDGMTGRTRAFVQVQNGCDHRCTFCIIPYGRGNSRSVPMGVVVEQIRTLVENGTREAVLTGVDITSYGKDLPGEPRFGTLGARHPAACTRARAVAHFLDRFPSRRMRT